MSKSLSKFFLILAFISLCIGLATLFIPTCKPMSIFQIFVSITLVLVGIAITSISYAIKGSIIERYFLREIVHIFAFVFIIAGVRLLTENVFIMNILKLSFGFILIKTLIGVVIGFICE